MPGNEVRPAPGPRARAERRMIMAAEHVQPAIASYEQPDRSTCDRLPGDDPVAGPPAAAAGRVSTVIDRPVRKQRGEPVPEGFQQP